MFVVCLLYLTLFFIRSCCSDPFSVIDGNLGVTSVVLTYILTLNRYLEQGLENGYYKVFWKYSQPWRGPFSSTNSGCDIGNW